MVQMQDAMVEILNSAIAQLYFCNDFPDIQANYQALGAAAHPSDIVSALSSQEPSLLTTMGKVSQHSVYHRNAYVLRRSQANL